MDLIAQNEYSAPCIRRKLRIRGELKDAVFDGYWDRVHSYTTMSSNRGFPRRRPYSFFPGCPLLASVVAGSVA